MSDVPIGTVTARWAAGFPVHYAPEHRVLQPGDEAQVPAAEADGSDNWEVVGGKKAIDAALAAVAKAEKQQTAQPDPEPDTTEDGA